jgi:putative phosphoesterase
VVGLVIRDRRAALGAASIVNEPAGGETITVGLISDTHGLLRADVFTALADVDLILHAGDVGGDDILDELAAIAPVHAVFGNTDPAGHPRLAARIDRTFGGVSVHVSHGHEVGSPTPEKLLAAYASDVIVYGHTHRGVIARHGTRLVVNPGAAGARRFQLLPSVALLRIAGGRADAELISLAG